MNLSFRQNPFLITFTVVIIIIITQTFVSCAKIGNPSGGPHDRTPPKLRRANPQPNSVNFKAREFEIEFDEYIVLANTSEEIIISPPLKTKPTIKSNLRTLKVSWTDTLEDNTTYIFDFGSSILDYTEGNKLNNFSYSFSTGPYIDTNEYKGRVVDAYTEKPIPNIYVMLYKSDDFSIVSTLKPNYLTRTDSSGRYNFRNIAIGNYQILALEDKNQNLLYDLYNEGIAFSNERVEATIYEIDTITQLPQRADNILYFFEPKDTLIDIHSSEILSKHRLQLGFSNPITDSLELSFTYPSFIGKKDTNLYFSYNRNRDTIDIFSLGHNFDSIKLIVRDIGLEEEIDKYYKNRDKEIIKDTFKFISPKQNHNFFEKLLVEMPFPILDTSQIIEAYKIIPRDTTSIDTSIIHFRPSKLSPLYIELEEELGQGSSQKISIPEGRLSNSIGQVNDSLVFSLSLDNSSDYGNLYIIIRDTSQRNSSYIIVLEDPQGKEITRKYADIDTKIEFPYLKEGNYRLRMIFDKNRNKKWDYGDYYGRKLPEEIIYFDKTINIRKNWDIEEEWFF